jgi:hypothetical protein
MKKFLSVFVLMLFAFSIFATAIVSATENESEDISDDSLDSEVTTTSDVPVPTLYSENSEDSNDVSEESIAPENRRMMNGEDKPRDPKMIARSISASLNGSKPMMLENLKDLKDCMITPEFYTKLNELNKKLIEKSSKGEDVSSLKKDIEKLSLEMLSKKSDCTEKMKSNTHANGVAVGLNCDISATNKAAVEALHIEYKSAIHSNDTEAAKQVREKIGVLEEKIKEERKSCMEKIVPGLMNKAEKTRCDVPSELYDHIDKAKAKIAELEQKNLTVSEDLKKALDELESKIADKKAKCNALNVTKDVRENDVANYYRQRMSETLSGNDTDTKIQTLKELRKEIDETIKNMIEQKKELKFEDMKDVADKIRIRAHNVSVGDSSTNTKGFKLNMNMMGSNITITSEDAAVVLRHKGLNVTAEDITVDENGIFINGTLVKALPGAVFEHNKNFERNAQKIVSMKLEKMGDKAVYNTEYESKKRLFGFIPMTARQNAVFDSNDSSIISEHKPWWNAISTDVESDSTDNSTATQ